MISTNDKLQCSFETPYLFLIAYAVPDESGEPRHSPSLARVLTTHICKLR